MLYRSQNMILQFILVICLGIIGGLLYYNMVSAKKGDAQIEDKIDNLDLNCPECPQCPELANPVTKDDLQDIKQTGKSCATTDDIVDALFPGRSGYTTDKGRNFDIKPNEEYDLLPSYSLYDSSVPYEGNMMMDMPLHVGNVNISQDQIDNSLDGNNMNTSSRESLTKINEERNLDTRMNRGVTANSNMNQNKNNRNNATRSKAPNTTMELTNSMKNSMRNRNNNNNNMNSNRQYFDRLGISE